MNAIISCKDHDHARREIYDICETNEGGEVSPVHIAPLKSLAHSSLGAQTALQVYCQAYKQAPIGQAHALLRKARRLDQILNVRTDAVVIPPEQPSPDPECHRCHSQFSPAFYRLPLSNGSSHEGPSSSDLWVCHKCHFDAGRLNGADTSTSMDTSESMSAIMS